MSKRLENDEPSVIILLSGGIDSTALIHFYKKLKFAISAVFIDYGQLSKKYELRAVKKICNLYCVRYRVIKVLDKTKFGKGKITGRNLFLISTALMFSNLKKGIIAIGVHAGTNYVDCNKPFVETCNILFTDYSDGKIILAAPFLELSKTNIIKYCRDENVPLQLTYSCEKGDLNPCGLCGTCRDINKIYARKDQ